MPYRYDQNTTNGEHEVFETPTLEPQDWWQGTARSWPKSNLTTTTVEQLKKKAELQEKEKDDQFFESLSLKDMGSATDAEPRTMDFFAGRSYAEGRAAYNQARIAQGLPPLSEGSR